MDKIRITNLDITHQLLVVQITKVKMGLDNKNRRTKVENNQI